MHTEILYVMWVRLHNITVTVAGTHFSVFVTFDFCDTSSCPCFYGSVPVLCSVLLLQFKKFNCGWEVTALMLDPWFQVSTNFHESSYNIRR